MNRILEPELMEDEGQVLAYAQADFSEPNDCFLQYLMKLVDPDNFSGYALDIGCGPGNISGLVAEAFLRLQIDAIDGSAAMLDLAERLTPSALQSRIRFIRGKIQDVLLPRDDYDLIFSNSLLHHLPEPQSLWQMIKRCGKSGTRVAVMDLLRPETSDQAKCLVEMYAADEPEVLRRDFYHSLLAAFTFDEIVEQLDSAGLDFELERISDRHVFVSGVL